MAGDFGGPTDYPSTRYFQIHFQHLHDAIEILKQQVHEANRQIAQQNEILRTVMEQTDELPGSASRPPAKPQRQKNPSLASNFQSNPRVNTPLE